MLMFKKIEQELLEVTERLKVWGEDADRELDEQRLDLLWRMVAYTNSYMWLTHSNPRDKIKYFLQSRYNYRQTAEKFGVTVKSLHVSVSYASDRLKKRIGSAFEQLQAGNIVDAEREFALGTGAMSPELFISEIHDRYAPVKNVGVDLSTCEKELEFLSRFTQYHFNMVTTSLDRQKLEHLLFILMENDKTYMMERGILFRCLEGEFEPAQALARLRNHYIYAAPILTDD